jgi:hypothetical protein
MDWNLPEFVWAVSPSTISDLSSCDSDDDNAAQAEIVQLNRQIDLLIADYVTVVRMYLEVCREHHVRPFAAGAGNTLERAE